MSERICEVCSSPFEATYRRDERRFCSRDCRNEGARMGLLPRRVWTDEEIGFVVANHHLTAREIGSELGRTSMAVAHMRAKLQKGWSPTQEEWSEEDDAFLLENRALTAEAAAKALGRSYAGVANRRRHLAARAGVRFGGPSKNPNDVGRRRLLARTCIKCGVLLDGSFFQPQKRGYRADCTKCLPSQKRTDTSKQRNAEAGRAFIEKMQALTRPLAFNNRQPWVESDHEVLRNPDLLIVDKALRLGRTYVSVANACSQNGYASKVGQLDPVKGRWVIDNPNQPAAQNAA